MADQGKPKARLPEFDGLRGWGSVFVLLFHVFSEVLPVTPYSGIFLRHLLPFSGLYAVMIFFVVSGVALSYKYLGKFDDAELAGSAAGRYFRLAIPILVLCFTVHLALVLGLLSPAADRLPVFAKALNFETNIWHVLQFSLFDVFFRYSQRLTYAGPLWTMSVEFIGSFLLFGALFLASRTRHILLVLCLMALLLAASAQSDEVRLYSLFLFGAALGGALQRGWFSRIPPPLAVFLLALGLLSPVLLPPAYDFWNIIGAVVLTIGCVAFRWSNAFLRDRLSQTLGKVSFALYLVHGPVMMFVGDPLTRHFGSSAGMKIAIDLCVVALSFIAALPMTAVTEYSSVISRRVGSVAIAFCRSISSSGRNREHDGERHDDTRQVQEP